MLAVQVRHRAEETVHAVAVAIAPCGHGAARRVVVDGVHDGAAGAVEDCQEFRTGKDIPGGVAVVRGRVADHGTGTVCGAVRGLHRQLGLAVAVKVVGEQLGVVRARPDVVAQIDAPQLGAVHLVGVHVDVAGIAGLRVVLGVGRRPRLDDLVLAVAVQVGHAGVVGGVGIGLAVLGDAVGRLVQLDGQVVLRHRSELPGELVLPVTVAHRLDDVLGGRSALRIDVHGGVPDGVNRKLHAVADDMETDAVPVQAQHPPAERDALVRENRHGRTVQVFHLAFECGPA
ncbi:hypothetical protein D9M72_426580 [compost metagenome]